MCWRELGAFAEQLHLCRTTAEHLSWRGKFWTISLQAVCVPATFLSWPSSMWFPPPFHFIFKTNTQAGLSHEERWGYVYIMLGWEKGTGSRSSVRFMPEVWGFELTPAWFKSDIHLYATPAVRFGLIAPSCNKFCACSKQAHEGARYIKLFCLLC